MRFLVLTLALLTAACGTESTPDTSAPVEAALNRRNRPAPSYAPTWGRKRLATSAAPWA